jgi:RNA polymerase sigma-70 factor (ECF subfamily)
MNAVLNDTVAGSTGSQTVEMQPTAAGRGEAPGPSGAEESSLLAQARSGDGAAFETMVRRFGGRMLAAAQRLLRNEEDAEDALQEAFLSAFQSIHRFEGQSRLGTWLHRIAINAALMKLRSRKRRKDRSIEDLLPTFSDDGHRRDVRPSWPAGGETLLERQELRAMVRRKIDLLPGDYRTVLVLRDMEELSTDETAEVLGINPGAVKTRLHRARMALRTLIEPELS